MSIGGPETLAMENLYGALEAAIKVMEEQEPTGEGPESETEELVSERGTGVSEQETSSNKGS